MPLKREVLPLLDERSALVDAGRAPPTRSCSTAGGGAGSTPMSAGIVGAFADAGVTSLEYVQVLGAGATAASVLAAVAAARRDARARVGARSREGPVARAAGRALGLDLAIRPLGMMDRSMIIPSAVISTLPGGTADRHAVPRADPRRRRCCSTSPTSRGRARWRRAGPRSAAPSSAGSRCCCTRPSPRCGSSSPATEDGELPHEAEVVAAMRSAVAL